MPRRLRFVSVFVILLAATACDGQDGQDGETYGFIATLGNDTTSVERITRTGDRIVSDAVGRSPIVVRRRWEATLEPDGSLRHWTMHTHIPNADAGAAELYHEAVFDDSSVRLIRRTGSDTTDVTYAKSYAVTVPWNAFVYGTYEVLFQAARGMADSTRIGQYFFEGWAEGTIGYARVRALGGDSVDIRSTGLSGAGVAHLDPEGRLLSYSGEGTTYVQGVARITDVPDIDAIAARFAETERATGVSRSLSPRDTARATVGGVSFAIDYSRPLARGRTLVGGLIPNGRVWRTGANAATQLNVSASVELGGIPLDSGTYTLWTLPADNDVQLIINRQTGQWGTQYGAAHDIARVPMQIDTAAAPVEQFTIRIDANTSETPRLVVEWGTFRWSVPVAVADR
jgi:hypothetical protein